MQSVCFGRVLQQHLHSFHSFEDVLYSRQQSSMNAVKIRKAFLSTAFMTPNGYEPKDLQPQKCFYLRGFPLVHCHRYEQIRQSVYSRSHRQSSPTHVCAHETRLSGLSKMTVSLLLYHVGISTGKQSYDSQHPSCIEM